ncbi:unnamed protein product [Psylliodes chrysocephalus]|uniref:SIAH-type domain-containing protein n=1 Tax=Psylliodes chrysocephalus TaxID=3402493 RepID=A0A9P0G740_9CUCU|nr:unnamed protein product [Psylliodes chrysocephala]
MFLLPEEVLNNLLCSVCFKYLSVKPVKVYINRSIKCGRCSDDKDDGIVSMYETIAENKLFPCVNRYEGCTQLLAFSGVSAHEKECVSNYYACPICSVEFTSFLLVQHYKRDHSSAILEKPEIVFAKEKECENYYMYIENNFVYILYIRCNIADQCFYLNAACLGSPARVEKIEQCVKCYLGDVKDCGKLFLQTKKQNCTLVENNSESFKIPFPKNTNSVTMCFYFDNSADCYFNYINKTISSTTSTSETVGLLDNEPILSSEYQKEHIGNFLIFSCTKIYIKRKEIAFCNISTSKLKVTTKDIMVLPKICHFCENIFPISNSITLYKSPKNKFFCHICYALNPTKLNHADLEASMFNSLCFYCKWNCGSFFHATDLRNHEYSCKENIQDPHSSTLTSKYLNVYSNNRNTYSISRTNVFSFKEHDFKNGEKIFVIIQDYFKFVLHSSYGDGVYQFWVTHDYPKDTYYVLFKVISNCSNNISFFFEKCLIKNSNSYFAVVLKKKNVSLTVYNYFAD